MLSPSTNPGGAVFGGGFTFASQSSQDGGKGQVRPRETDEDDLPPGKRRKSD